MIGTGYHREARRFRPSNESHELVPSDVLADVQPETKPTLSHNDNLPTITPSRPVGIGIYAGDRVNRFGICG